MSTHPDEDPSSREHDEKATDASEPTPGTNDQQSNSPDPDVDPKTQYAGVTIDPDHPNDEG